MSTLETSDVLPTPAGNPDELESYASSLASAAGRMDVLASSTVRVTADIKSNANWTGTASEGYSGFTGGLAQSAGDTVSHLHQIESSVRTYAAYLRTAREKVAAYNKAYEAATCLAPGKKRQQALAALANVRQEAIDAMEAADAAGDSAALEVKGSATLQSVYVQGEAQALDEQTAPPASTGPEWEPAPPGWQERAAKQAQFWQWMRGGNLPDDPHAEGASGTGYENPYTNVGGTPEVGDAAEGGG